MTALLILSVMKEGGVNRLSMGVQTFNNDLLKAIGRKHTKENGNSYYRERSKTSRI